MKVVLVYNPRSGTAPSIHDLRRYFKQADVSIGVEIKLESGFEKKLKRHLRPKQIIAVVGGDGTMSSVANLMHGTEAILAPLPGGTLNHFTKDLGIEQNIEQAIKDLADSRPRAVDYATVNDRVFVNNSSIGLYPSALQARAHIEDKLGKWPAAVIGSIRAWVRFRRYQLTVNGEEITTPFIFIGNNDYHVDQPTNVGRKHLNKGVLSIYAITAKTRWDVIKLIGSALRNKLTDMPDIQSWQTTEVIIHSSRETLRVAYDGEYTRLKTPLTYKIVASGLLVIGNS